MSSPSLERDPVLCPPGWLALPSETDPAKVYYYNVYSRTSRWDLPQDKEPLVVKARHILVKFDGVRDNKLKGKKQGMATRTKLEAETRARELHARVTIGGESFEEVAKEESDCSSYAHGGHLGKAFSKGGMHAPFSYAAFSLAVNEISGVVLSPSGFHIIQRLE